MKKYLVLLIVALTSFMFATPVGVSFMEPLENQRVDKGIVFDATVVNANLAAAVTYNYLIEPAFDMVLYLESGSETALKVVVYEDPTATGVGSVQTAYNQNRNSSKVATAIATLTSAIPTISVQGTAIYSDIAQNGEVNKRLVLNGDSDYLIQLTNLGTVTGDVSLGLTFLKNVLRLR